MKSNEVYFMPLGGGQSVGASCYYLRLGSSNVILDAGTGFVGNMVFEPDFLPLLTSPLMLSLGQLDQIFISHAHMDHTGYLMTLMKDASRAGVYMTEPTRRLVEFQLYEKKYLSKAGRASKDATEAGRLATQYLLQRITTVNYMHGISFRDYKAEFFQAGHVPGAMMTLIRYGNRNILYTGDYSIHSMPLTNGCVLPDDLKVDTLILCGLHAKEPGYRRRADSLHRRLKGAISDALGGSLVVCRLSQLTKGVEFLKMLNLLNSEHVPVYVDDGIMRVVEVMERLSVPILTKDNYPVSHLGAGKRAIVVASSDFAPLSGNATVVNADFSLHEDFEDMRDFIKMLDPRHAVIVHSPSSGPSSGRTIEQEIMNDCGCRTQFTFAEDKEMYVI